MIKCDICAEMATDSLTEDYRADGVKGLCSDCSYEVYKFETGLIAINSKRKSGDRVNKQDLVKAKVVCMKNRLSISIDESAKDSGLINWVLNKIK